MPRRCSTISTLMCAISKARDTSDQNFLSDLDFWATAETYNKLCRRLNLPHATAVLDHFDIDVRYLEGPRYIGPKLLVRSGFLGNCGNLQQALPSAEPPPCHGGARPFRH